MFTKTFTTDAVSIARRISGSAKKDLEHLKADDLDGIVLKFSTALKGHRLEKEVSRAFGFKKADSAALLRRVAEDVLQVAKKEGTELSIFARRHSFYADMVRYRDKIHNEDVPHRTADLNRDSNGWWSYVNDLIECKARHQALAEFTRTIEACCSVMSLGEATEHALYKMQRDVMQAAGQGTHNSTSAVYNVCEEELMKERSKILRDGLYYGLHPVNHEAKFETDTHRALASA